MPGVSWVSFMPPGIDQVVQCIGKPDGNGEAKGHVPAHAHLHLSRHKVGHHHCAKCDIQTEKLYEF